MSINKYKWYRRLRGGVWVKWHVGGWNRESFLQSRFKSENFPTHQTEDYRNLTLLERLGIKLLSVNQHNNDNQQKKIEVKQ